MEIPQSHRLRLGRFLDSRKTHLLILFLVLLDLVIVVTELTISLYDLHDHLHHTLALKVLSNISLGILSLFLFELVLHIYAFGLGYFCNWVHAMDATVIVVSFALEVALRGAAREIASLLIILRFWRIVRVADAVAVSVEWRVQAEIHEQERHSRVLTERLLATEDQCRSLEGQLRQEMERSDRLEQELQRLYDQSNQLA
ncbi:hypothetical protein BJ684DRAFT_22011 [Piptocephalis cylindrospora]|uniref:Voltage-gated hydrogen channel 1 n=1 Tax=Piptocephalis cylindrospora TaxID=1907219 RepID=A0A4P9XZ68_9FUNG|nr:hypothetical protein BJ684DRAFT_22011 [Piptocephalis cylindrospora]|eukprot:RKP11422.1 hypothetical protein BJ684DRAFT_22011 [Piptocephalis cylindrospora]